MFGPSKNAQISDSLPEALGEVSAFGPKVLSSAKRTVALGAPLGDFDRIFAFEVLGSVGHGIST
jgi:hypothetical protein